MINLGSRIPRVIFPQDVDPILDELQTTQTAFLAPWPNSRIVIESETDLNTVYFPPPIGIVWNAVFRFTWVPDVRVIMPISVSGGIGDDLLLGGLLGDGLSGGAGNDAIFGIIGNDSLIGGLGDDFLYGGMDNDFLAGGLGSDQLTGDEGIDRFVFNPGDSTTDELDVITDLNADEDEFSLRTSPNSSLTWFHRPTDVTETMLAADTVSDVAAGAVYSGSTGDGIDEVGVGINLAVEVAVIAVTGGALVGTDWLAIDWDDNGVTDDIVDITGYVGEIGLDTFF